MTSTDAELRPRRMSGLSSIQMVRSAKLLSIWTRADSLATADFRYKSAIFCARGFPPMPQARNLSAERSKWQSSLVTLPFCCSVASGSMLAATVATSPRHGK